MYRVSQKSEPLNILQQQPQICSDLNEILHTQDDICYKHYYIVSYKSALTVLEYEFLNNITHKSRVSTAVDVSQNSQMFKSDVRSVPLGILMKFDVDDKNRCRLVCVKFLLNRCRFAAAVAKCLGGFTFLGHSVSK